MAKYKLTPDKDVVQDIKTTAFIPVNSDIPESREYKNWLKGLDADGEDLGIGPNKPDKD